MARDIYIALNERPRIILNVMDRVKQEAVRTSRGQNLGCLITLASFGLGAAFFVFDRVMGFGALVFSLVAYALWAFGAFMAVYLWRRRAPALVRARFDAARTIIYTLRDDVAPKKLVTGWVDLTTAQDESKIAREGWSRSGKRRKVYYRDHWLQLKMPLADGNLLRLSLIEKVKTKTGYSPRRTVQAKARLVVNPRVYRIKPFSPESFPLRTSVAEKEGIFYLSDFLDPDTYDPWPLLQALKALYQYLEPIAAPS